VKICVSIGKKDLPCFYGFNITVVVGLFAFLFGVLLGKLIGVLAAGLAIAVYTLLVGAEAAVERAATSTIC